LKITGIVNWHTVDQRLEGIEESFIGHNCLQGILAFEVEEEEDEKRGMRRRKRRGMQRKKIRS
jgi:hypothetical protein